MAIKLKITGKKPMIYTQDSVEDIPRGTILEVIKGHEGILGDIIMKTDEEEYPFITLTGLNPQDAGMVYGGIDNEVQLQVVEFEIIK